MKSLLILHRPDFGMYAEDTAAMDWFVIATLCIFFFLLGCFGSVAWQIWRRTTRPEPHIKLLMELADSDADTVNQKTDDHPPVKESPQAPWEQPADWWKR